MSLPPKAVYDLEIDQKIKQLTEYGKGLIEKIYLQWVPEFLERWKSQLNIQPNVLNLCCPIKIVGSIHGHFKDLIKIFQRTGSPSDVSYIFLGNYIDFGPQSLETILLLLLYKMKYPSTFFLLRGCHENSTMSKIYGFKQQCKLKNTLSVWQTFCTIFTSFPYAAVVNHKILCISGGISPALPTVRSIQQLSKNSQCMGNDLQSHIVWSEPSQTVLGFGKNMEGYGFMYGRDAVQKFLTQNHLQLICRSKNLINEGFQLFFNKKVISIFSVPNFTGKFNNSASILSISNNLECQIQVFKPKSFEISASDLIY